VLVPLGSVEKPRKVEEEEGEEEIGSEEEP
jgi:hypothetical protein